MQEVKCCIKCNRMSLMEINQGYCETCLPILPKTQETKMKWHKYPEEKHLLNEGQSYKIVHHNNDLPCQDVDIYLGTTWLCYPKPSHFAPLDPMPEDDDIDEDFKELSQEFEQWHNEEDCCDNDIIIAICQFLEKKFKVKK